MNIVKELRKKAGIQQKELAIIIGVSRPTVSEWEANKKDPSGDRLKKLADYFGVDELMILGKGVVDLVDEKQTIEDPKMNNVPRTIEARIVSAWMDDVPKESREKLLSAFLDAYAKIKQDSAKKGADLDEA